MDNNASSTNATITTAATTVTLLIQSAPPSAIWLGAVRVALSPLAVPLHCFVAAVILYKKDLRKRKEFIIIALMCMCDALFGIGVFTNGMHTIAQLYQPTRNVTSVWCIGKYLFHAFTVGLYCSMLVFLSMDRLICVISFNFYERIENRLYVVVILLSSFTVAALQAVTVIVGAILVNASNIDLTCPNWAVLPTLGMMATSISYIGGGGSCALYLVVVIIVRLRPLSNYRSISATQLNRQRKITKVFGFMSLFTFIAYVCPNVVQSVQVYTPIPDSVKFLIAMITSCIYMLHSPLCICIYLSRPSEVRSAILRIFERKVEHSRTIPVTDRGGMNRVS